MVRKSESIENQQDKNNVYFLLGVFCKNDKKQEKQKDKQQTTNIPLL